AVLVVEVVGMLPYVETQDGRTAQGADIHQRVVLVGRIDHGEMPGGIDHQPGPARPELGRRSAAEGLLEFRKAAEAGLDIVGQFAGRLAAAVGRHDLPEQVVVVVPAAVVPYRGAQLRYLAEDLLDGLAVHAGAFQGR